MSRRAGESVGQHPVEQRYDHDPAHHDAAQQDGHVLFEGNHILAQGLDRCVDLLVQRLHVLLQKRNIVLCGQIFGDPRRVVNRKGCAPAHRTLANAALGALRGGPLPEQEALLAARREVLEALAAPDRPAGLPQALITRMAQVFTQSEIWALTDANEALPESVPALGAQTRTRISDWLMDAARAREPGLRPDSPEGAAMETEKETRMKEPQETRDKTTIRGETMSSLLLDDVSEETFSDLRKGFSFEEIRALRDPERALPAGLPDITADERRQIAAVLTAGPPKPQRSGTGGGPAAFVPGPKYDGRALQLACAITERVVATDPVHRRDLVSDIRALLKAADATQDLLETRVREITAGLTNARVALDTKLALAHEVVKDDPRGPEAQVLQVAPFLESVGDRNETPRRHPLWLHHTDIEKAYDRQVSARLDEAFSKVTLPTQAEKSVARIVALTNPPAQSKALVEALQYVFREGSLKPVEHLMQERKVLLTDLAERREWPKKVEGELERIYRSFTHREILALAQPHKNLPGTLPSLNDTRHTAVAQGLKQVSGRITLRSNGYAWGAAAQSLEEGLHPERARSRARGLGMSL